MSERFSIALAGSYNTRVSETNTLSSASGIVGLGVVGTMIVGATVQSTDKDQRFLNCYTETVMNSYTGKRTLYCTKRPGWAALNTPASGNIGTAIMVWTGQGTGTKVISAFGGTNSTIYDSTASLGAITGKATKITETFVGTTATLVISSSDSTAWYYDVATGAATKITDADFPGNASLTLAGTFAHLDGYACILDTAGTLWNSDLNSMTAWTATSSIAANSYPDKGVGLVRWRDKIMAMGSESTQFFYNAGNPTGSPLSRIESMTLRVGCVAADAIAQVEDAVYWCGSSPQGGLSIYEYGGAGLKTISKPEIDRILVLAGAANISMTAVKIYGRNFIIVNASSVTFVCCIEENYAWHEWNSTVRLWYKCAGVSSGGTQVVYAVSDKATTGKVYTVNPSSIVYQDDGGAFTARIQTSKLGEGGRRVFWEEVELLGDQQTAASTTTIAYSDDDYQTYTTLGTVDLSASRPRLHRAGSSYRRAWAITNAANTAMRLEALIGRRSMGTG